MARVYCIGELGINHQGSLDVAKQLIDAAKEAGCDAVKFQKRTIDKVYSAEELAKPRESVFGRTNGDLKRGLEFGQGQFEQLFDYARQSGLDCSASCWDIESVSFMAQFSPPFLKIPSALITDVPLLEAYRDTGIPLLVSTGMSTWEEIDGAVDVLMPGALAYLRAVQDDGHSPQFDYDGLTLLHCHSSYPSPLEEINLACIQSFKERYPGVKVGYSSHTVSPWPCLMAAVYGAEVIEFHLTLDRSMWGSDQSASLEPHAAKKLVEEIRTFERCKGDGVKRVYPSEMAARDKLRKVRSA